MFNQVILFSVPLGIQNNTSVTLFVSNVTTNNESADLVYCLFPCKSWLKNRQFSEADGDKVSLGKSYSWPSWVMDS